MPKNYYPDSNRFPKIELALVERVLIYVAHLLYEDEYNSDPQLALKRLVLSDVESGQDVMIGDSIEEFKNTQGQFPFTAYALSESIERTDLLNHTAKGGFIFCKEAHNYVRSFPMELEIPMFTFFNTGEDYFQARSLLHRENVGLTRLRVPIQINGVDTDFPIDIEQAIGKGAYAASFEEYLRVNRIWDIRHDITVLFHDFMIDDQVISLVDNMVMTLAGKISTLPDLPRILEVVPADKSIDVPVDVSVQIRFSKPINESSVDISLKPEALFYRSWSSDSTMLTLTNLSNFKPNTVYEVVIAEGAFDAFGLHLSENFHFTFTTE